MTKRRTNHHHSSSSASAHQHQQHGNQAKHHQHHSVHQQHQQDDDFIPLPIQTFLWRQTSPFVRPFLGKARDLAQIEQRDACKLFERIIITNNIWGQSPSLTDAISSIDRWRLIKVSFPFVLQCTAALLNNKLIKEHNFNRLGGNEAKMMYTLQWILMNASEECADSENEAKSNATNVAMAAATAASLLKPNLPTSGVDPFASGSAGHHQFGSGSGGGGGGMLSTINSQASNSSQTGSITQVGPSEQQVVAAPASGPTATNQSIMLPAAAAVLAIAQPGAASVLQSAGQQQQQQPSVTPTGGLQLNSSSSVSPIGSSTPTQPGQQQAGAGAGAQSTGPSQQQQQAGPTTPSAQFPSSPGNYLLPISSIKMFAYYFAPIMDGLKHSDFLSSNQRLEIGAALWEPLFNYQLPDIHCLKAPIKQDLEQEQFQAFLSEAAGKSQQQVASGAATSSGGGDQTATAAAAAHFGSTTTSALGHDRRRSSSVFNDSAHFGDVFLGGPSPPASSAAGKSTFLGGGAGSDSMQGARSSSMAAHMEASILLTKTSPATYLDVAVLRCLFISDWQESGVFWAINYLASRFNEKLYSSKRSGAAGADGTSATDDDHDEQLRQAAKLASQRRRSKSLSCAGSDELVRSLTLRRDHFRQSKGTGQSGASKTSQESLDVSAGGGGGGKQRGKQSRGQRDSSTSSRFLRVGDPAEGDAPDGGDPRDVPKSPIRRLSFSSGMQTLANQIRKTSKRVKKSSQESAGSGGETSDQAQGGGGCGSTSQLNTGAEQVSSRSLKHRRSSSADDLNSAQVSALSLLQRDSQQEQLRSQMTDSNPVITVTPNERAAAAAAIEAEKAERHSRKKSRLPRDGAASPVPIVEKTKQEDRRDGDDGRQDLIRSLYSKSSRHLERLTRTQSVPRGMRFVGAPQEMRGGRGECLDKSEALGADYYVDEQGRIDPLVVLKVLHSISQRENACSLRVCDKLLFLMNRLISIGILKDRSHYSRGSTSGLESSSLGARRRSSLLFSGLESHFGTTAGAAAAAGLATQRAPGSDPKANLLPTRQLHEFTLLQQGAQAHLAGQTSHDAGRLGNQMDDLLELERRNLIHKVLIDIVFRLHHHLGCPNHCGVPSTVDQHHRLGQASAFRPKVSSFSGGHRMSTSGPGSGSGTASQTTTSGVTAAGTENPITWGKNLRLSLRDSLEQLAAHNKQNFIRYLQDVFADRKLPQVIEIFHSLLGFCRPDYLSYLRHRQSAANPSQPHVPSSTTTGSQQQVPITVPTSGGAQPTVQFATPTPRVTGTLRDPAEPMPAAPSQSTHEAKRRKSVAPCVQLEPVESVIVTNSFKQLITRMAGMSKELKAPENSTLYCDIRRLINFIRENYNSTFRSIVLSALIDCTKLLNQHQPRTVGRAVAEQQPAQQRPTVTNLTRPSSDEDESLGGQRDKRAAAAAAPGGACSDKLLSTDEELSSAADTVSSQPAAHAAVHRAHEQQHRTSSGSQQQLAAYSSSPSHAGGALGRALQGSSTAGPASPALQESHGQSSSGILSLSKAKKKLEQVFGGGGAEKGSTLPSSGSLSGPSGGGTKPGGGSGGGGKSLSSAKIGEDLNSSTAGSLSCGQDAAQAGVSGGDPSSSAAAPEETSRRASIVGHQSISGSIDVGPAGHTADQQPGHHQQQAAASIGPLNIQIIKQNQLIYETVQVGMSSFSFLMESCLPGDFLDPALLAALLDLKSPIAIRAAVFLECANFVHRCNRGQWPSWMRMNVPAAPTVTTNYGAGGGGGGGGFNPGHRGSNAGLLQAANSAKLRKSSSIQRTARNNTLMYRAAGRAFYAWAEAVGARLEELLNQQQQQQQQQGQPEGTGAPQSQADESLLMNDIDFLQPTLGATDDSSPFVLKMAACQLLFEVTTFLRETYRYLPPTIVQHQLGGSGKPGDKLSSIYDVSRAVTANRRWSMALSSLGFGQLPATLSNALAGGGGGGGPPPTQSGGGGGLRASGVAGSTISEQPERRISFILHETKDEDQQAHEDASEARESSITGGGHQYDIQSTTGSELEGSTSGALRRAISTAGSGSGSHGPGGGSGGAVRHLSQSSASSAVVVAAATLLRSSGVIDSQSHRRKSIKLRKPSQEKESKQEKKAKFAAAAQANACQAAAAAAAIDFDEELENSSLSDAAGVRRTDSMRSRRRVSGISERSDTSANVTALAGGPDPTKSAQAATGGCELSGNDSGGNGSVAGGPAAGGGGGGGGGGYGGSYDDHLLGSLAGKFEVADETKIMSNMPWFKAISLVNSSVDCNCNHFPTCKPSCYKLHQSMCKRLVSFVQTIYQDPTEQNYLASIFEKRLANLISDQQQLHKRQKDQQRKQELHKSDPAGQHHKASGAGILRAGSDCSGAESDQAHTLIGPKRKDKKSKRPGGRHHQIDSPSLIDHTKGALQSPKGHYQQPTTFSKAHFGHHAHQPQLMMGHLHDSMTSHHNLPLHGGSFGRAGHGHGQQVQSSAIVADTIKILRAAKAKERHQEEPPMIKYLRSNVKSLLHCPMSSFLKGAIILPRESFAEMVAFSWNLLLEDDQQLSRTAAVCFIVSAIKCPTEASRLLIDELESPDASRKMAAINKFYVVWDARYQCWPRLEDGAFVHFKMAPPSIEFTLPSPKIAQESSPVVDPPWMHREKKKNVDEMTINQDQTVQKSFVTATKTRRKQQMELVSKALREKHDKLREDRESYNITSVPITLYAAFEPTLGGPGGQDGEGMEGGGAGAGTSGAGGGASGSSADDDAQENRALFQMKTAQALFPTCLCQSALVMINLLDDPRVTYEGSAVYELASKVIWSCLVEDPALFLRYFFERLTRQTQSTIFQVLRRLIRFMPRLPPQAAYTLYNFLIGFIIYLIRFPVKDSSKLIADTLSVLCLVVPSVHGLFLKDLKQILRKEQCDQNLLITANVPSTKKIIIHNSGDADSGEIPSQFPIDDSTQFYHVLVDSLEFFGIEKSKYNEYFLYDRKHFVLHNLHSYVRDYYSFKRSAPPGLHLVHMDPSEAFDVLQRQELTNQFMEFGKVLMSLSIVKSSHMPVQRALFLHEELMKLPTFPRRALETNFSLFRGPLGHQVFSMDRIHKICWVRVIARMFELTSGFFLQLGDIQLFLNAVSGIFVLHCEEASVSRLCLATFINATHQFKSIFATDGFMPIMATIVQVYSNHQNNQLLCRSIEFVCKQFYIMHRKPFLLQLFGSIASRLNTAEILQQNNTITCPVGLYQQTAFQQTGGCGLGGSSSSTSGLAGATASQIQVNDPNRISPSAFFRLLMSLEKAFKDPLDILELVDAEKPLRAVDFCYQQDKESIEILDIISLCVTVTAYASESPRSTQMLIILESVVPLYMKQLQASTSKKAGQSMGKQAHKDELQKIQSISICIRTLIVNCEGLTRNFSGPLPSIDFRSSSIRRTGPSAGLKAGVAASQKGGGAGGPNNSAGSPFDICADEPSFTGPEPSASKSIFGGGGTSAKKSAANTASDHQAPGKQTTFAPRSKAAAAAAQFNSDETEITRGEFIVPRDTLLNLVAEFLALSTGRLVESAKKYVELHQKHSSYELLDVKSHLRLAEVANSLLKFASTDPSVMACRGLIRYMNEILPNTEWRQEAIRPALIMILKRLDKTFNRIAKKNWVKRSTDWEAAKQLLKGAYLTFIKHPYIVHLPHLKSLISCCQNIILSDGGLQSGQLLSSNLLHGFASAATTTGGMQQQQPPVGSGGLQTGGGQPGTSTGGGPSLLQTTTGGGPSAALSKFQASASNVLTVGLGSAGRHGKSSSPAGSASALSAGPVPTTASSPSTGAGTAPALETSGQQQHQAVGGGTPSLAAVTAAAALAERLAASTASGTTITSQGFNSVTIRLIAMQLLQTGDSQTLESFIGNSMNTPEKLESLMLNLIYPMCIRVCSGAREAPKLRVCDIMFILNIVLQMLAPQSASSKSPGGGAANSPKGNAAADTSQFILSKITTTIGATQTGATALNIVSGGGASSHSQASGHQLVQHQEALKIGFLGLKILCVCFESQLASEWIRIARVIRDLALQPGQPSGPLWDFLDFVVTYRFPMFVLLLPTIRCDVAKKVKGTGSGDGSLDSAQLAHYRQCLRMIETKIHGSTASVCRSKSFLFVSLTAELRMLKEQLIAKQKQLLDGERNQHHHYGNQQAGGQSGSGNQTGGGGGPGGAGSASAGLGPNSGGLGGEGPGDHLGGAYHRLSAAIASFANQTGQMGQKLSPSASATSSTNQMSAALKGTCFAAQLATSAPIGQQIGQVAGEAQPAQSAGSSSQQGSFRLSTAKSREEARKVMNTILRRTSYPHNQPAAAAANLAPPGTTTGGPDMPAGGERKCSQPTSPSSGVPRSRGISNAADIDVEAGGNRNQIIMDPAMLIAAAFPAPRKSNVEGSSILKQLVQTIDRQNNQRQQQQQQQQVPAGSSAGQPAVAQVASQGAPSSSQQEQAGHTHEEYDEGTIRRKRK